MRAEHFRFDPEGIDRLVELVAERVVSLLEERRALSSTGEPAAPTDVDLAARIAAALNDGPVTVPELARRARLRDETVRRLVQSDPRFLPVPPPPGRSPKAKCWTLRLDSFSGGGRVRTNGSSRGRTGR